MTNPSNLLHLKRKKLVIKDIDYLIESKGIEQYENRKKSLIYDSIGWIWSKWFDDKKKRTLAPTKTPVDFLQAIENSNIEIDDMEEDIETILISASNDKNILEECENYLQRKYKIHLARMQSIISVLQSIVFIGTIVILAGFLGYFPIIDIKTSSPDVKTIGILASIIAVVTASTAITNTLLPIFKSSVEDAHVASTSAYEYSIELLKNAKLRSSMVNIFPQSLDRITTNPNKMNGQPCIRDLRLTVWRVLELLQTYPDRSELHREFPELTEEDIKQAIIYAGITPQYPVVAKLIAHETVT